MITLQSADKVLKSYYLDAITREIDLHSSPFLAKVEKTSANVVGKNVSKIIKLGVHSGVAAGSETGDLPTGGSGSYISLTAPLKNIYGTIEITDKAIRASANDEGAFVNLLNEEMDGLLKSAKFNFSRMLFGDGNGTVGTITMVGGSTLELTSVSGLAVGMSIDIYKQSNKTHTKIKIESVDKQLKTITVNSMQLAGGGTPAEGDTIRVSGVDGYELTGLGAIFSSKAIYGMGRTYEYMKPYIADSVGELTEDTLQLAIDKIEETSGSKVNMILCSWAVRRALTRCFKDRQFNFSMEDIGDNQQVLCYNGIPIVVDAFCPEGEMYLLNTDDFKIYQLCDWQWMEGEDGKILKQVAGKPIYTATLVKYAELVCEKPCGQGALRGITV